jgi:hypothetical protein
MMEGSVMVGLIIKILIASVAAFVSFHYRWWAPIIIFPLSFFVLPSIGSGDPYDISKGALEIRRCVFYLSSLIFISLMTYVFHIRIGSWYGWGIGMILGWLCCGSVAADLEKYLFFRAR